MTTTQATETATPATTAGRTTTRTTRASRARATTTPTPTPPTPAPPMPTATAPGMKEEHAPALDLNLPFLRIQLRAPEMHMPHVGMPHISGRDVGHAMDIARTFLPPPERIMYYGGLGALAALGLIEWPVAAAIGAGTMIAQRARSRDQRWSPLSGPQRDTAGAKGAAATPGTQGTAMPTPGTPPTGAAMQEAAASATRRASTRRTAAKGEAKTPATAGTSTRRGRAAGTTSGPTTGTTTK